MTKLTPARKALLQKLVDENGMARNYHLTPAECRTGTMAAKDGLCEWIETRHKSLWITEKGREALQNEGV